MSPTKLILWRLPSIGLWTAFLLLYSWPALWNGGPFFFPDTSHYIRAADAAVVSLTDTRSVWSDRLVERPIPNATAPAARLPHAEHVEIRPTRSVLTGRSIYYGAFLYAGLQMFGRYGPVILQAAAAVCTVALFLLGASASIEPRRRRRWMWGGLLAVGLLTPLPFFVSRLMPEAFTGLMIISIIALLLFWKRYTVPARTFLLLIAAASITFHISHILLTVAIGGGALLLNIGRKEGWWLRLALPVGLIFVAGVAQTTFSLAVTQTLGAPPIVPPFLSARLIADGPGYRYLEDHCPTSEFALCTYFDRMPRPSDIMLWSEDPRDGIFSAVPDNAKRELGREDRRFYLAVLRERPLEVIDTIIRSSAQQAVEFDLDHFNYIEAHRDGARQHLPPEVFAWVERSGAYHGTVPVRATIDIMIVTTIASLLILAWALLSVAGRSAWRAPIFTAVLLILLAFAANIVICGAMSTPHARYLMRIIWLLPLAVAALGAAGFRPREAVRIDLKDRHA